MPPGSSRDGEEARATLAGAGLPLFAGSVRRLVALQKAALAGVPVSRVADPRAAAAWGDYERVAGEALRGQAE